MSWPPVIDQPAEARAAALAAPEQDVKRAAETLVLLGDGQRALDMLRRNRTTRRDPRTTRLVAEASRAIYDVQGVRSAGERLGDEQGWSQAGRVFAQSAGWLKQRRLLQRIGLGLFALSLAVLGLSGARALLAIRGSTVVMTAATLAAVLIARQGAPRGVPVVALIGVGFLALAHAATSTVDRTRPDARGRLMAAALVVLGAFGLVLSVVARVPVEALWGLAPSAG